ncbi:hypothetical protein DUNSADRAFT_15325 [Dunaliella salina]|uniref:STI1/HOP DP domain-containing protein n=1 Tax=Dunaliella salina TaxID=3046 RepID=A0ABQ7G5P4_DUNSA|nr:hypothetical protein DUNSADRAFT_15325 [Dunaliella salina]|eukprot:KAF5829902.1 hypothetical protein DUNSADRAFT_15325 [Dunaliella salina]
MDGDDTPPPLDSLPDQLEALKHAAGSEGSNGSALASGPNVASTIVCTASRVPKKAPSLKKGFLDTKPTPGSKASKPASKPSQLGSEQEIPILRGKRDAVHNNKPEIPEFLRVEPDADERKYQKVRGELLEALKPTPDMMGKIQQNPDLLAGFGDPEVMAAVNDVAQNPQHMAKYRDNKKVQAFYATMASVMGQKLEGMGKRQ